MRTSLYETSWKNKRVINYVLVLVKPVQYSSTSSSEKGRVPGTDNVMAAQNKKLVKILNV